MVLFDLFKTDFTNESVLKKYPQLEYYMKENGDLFNESFIKCYEAIKDRNFDEESTIKYFTVILNNTFKKSKKKNIKFEDVYAVDEEDIYEIEEHSETRFNISDIINESVKKIFGEKKYTAWKLHFVNNKSYDELIEMGYDDINFHNLFRQINAYIKNKLPKENEVYKSLLKKASLK